MSTFGRLRVRGDRAGQGRESLERRVVEEILQSPGGTGLRGALSTLPAAIVTLLIFLNAGRQGRRARVGRARRDSTADKCTAPGACCEGGLARTAGRYRGQGVGRTRITYVQSDDCIDLRKEER
jgi:hypothetical protein